MPVSSTIVTARMDPVKKMKGNSVLKRNGYTPSSFINAIYDQIIEKDGVVFDGMCGAEARIDASDIQDAIEWTRSLPTIELTGEFSNMTTKQARLCRLESEL